MLDSCGSEARWSISRKVHRQRMSRMCFNQQNETFLYQLAERRAEREMGGSKMAIAQ